MSQFTADVGRWVVEKRIQWKETVEVGIGNAPQAFLKLFCGENTGKIWNNNVDALHLEFMAEPWVPINHRTNIMDPAFRRVGVGAVNGPDAMYMTMVFCR